jgi:hypothetical protein
MDGTPARLLTAWLAIVRTDALLRVLGHVDRGEHPEGHDGEAHEQDHEHGAEERREDSALGVGLARIADQKDPEVTDGRGDPSPEAHRVRPLDLDDLR